MTCRSIDRLTKESLPLGTNRYSYNSRGNRQTFEGTLPEQSAPTTYSFDERNRLRSASNETTGATASYTYHPDGLRASRTAGGKETRYVYLNGKVIEELDKNNQLQARNIWGNELLFRKDTAANKQGYYLYNSHGDVVKIVGEQGEELNRYEYDTWGNIVSKTEGMSNPFAYSGEMFDNETGFYYLRARYYDPTVGRFISEDTYKGAVDNPLSLNRYTYVSNNPLRYVDPSGHVQADAHGNGGFDKQRIEQLMNDVITGRVDYDRLPSDQKAMLKAYSDNLKRQAVKDYWFSDTVTGFASGFTLGVEAVEVAGAISLSRAMSTPKSTPSTSLTHLNPSEIRFSQNSAGGNGRYAPLKESMQKNGWNGPPVDVVQTPNGYVTIDNTRVAIARELNISSIPVNIRQMNELLPSSMAGRFGTAKTWGEALQHRTSKQRPPLPIDGTNDLPRLPK
ncbi:hypothetical protein NDK47_21220 [Brevibacillus ruminantium]|uniref:Teneurin-like YD-shell domain-containing protein n=1 Tax=Brevibacillus ruminantium TaxID=2950604 RepID=A0ABY4WH29_9BACL|nr:RHS repeat-associated core domain-containing protein [Brevibacillus ruminantium]USG64639.1 hypothetical protein NDK47_21220 [Brevibacillus ruminantium]